MSPELGLDIVVAERAHFGHQRAVRAQKSTVQRDRTQKHLGRRLDVRRRRMSRTLRQKSRHRALHGPRSQRPRGQSGGAAPARRRLLSMTDGGFDARAVPVLRERIFDVLKDADLSVISAKKIRIALSELPDGSLPSGVDLVEHKKAIDAEIRHCYDEVTKKGAPKSSSGDKKITLPGTGGVPGDESAPSKTKRKAEPAATKKAPKKRTKASEEDEPKKKRASNPNSALNRPMRLSAAMAEVCGGNEVRCRSNVQMPRYEVVKQLWVYIKARNLQNEENKRQILCDEKLTSLFGKDKVEYVVPCLPQLV